MFWGLFGGAGVGGWVRKWGLAGFYLSALAKKLNPVPRSARPNSIFTMLAFLASGVFAIDNGVGLTPPMYVDT